MDGMDAKNAIYRVMRGGYLMGLSWQTGGWVFCGAAGNVLYHQLFSLHRETEVENEGEDWAMRTRDLE